MSFVETGILIDVNELQLRKNKPFSCLAPVVTEKQRLTHCLGNVCWPASWHIRMLCRGLSKTDSCLAVRAVRCKVTVV